MSTVYVLHFDQPYWGKAQHYIGRAKVLAKRIAKHQAGTGSKLCRYALSKGITFQVVKTFRCTWQDSYHLELQKKHKGAKNICPICLKQARKEKKCKKSQICPYTKSTQKLELCGHALPIVIYPAKPTALSALALCFTLSPAKIKEKLMPQIYCPYGTYGLHRDVREVIYQRDKPFKFCIKCVTRTLTSHEKLLRAILCDRRNI